MICEISNYYLVVHDVKKISNCTVFFFSDVNTFYFIHILHWFGMVPVHSIEFYSLWVIL